MARPQPFPPPVRRHKSGQARVRWRGKDYYLGVYGSPRPSRRTAACWCDLEAGQDPGSTSAAGLTVAQAYALWLDHARADYDPAGREAQQHEYAARPVLALFGLIPATEFGPQQLEAVQQSMASGSWMTAEEAAANAKHGHATRWCRNVVNRRTVRIQTAWR